MPMSSEQRRTHSASRDIKASPDVIYQAFLNPDALGTWLPPEGMTAEISQFEPREGGSYRMALRQRDPDPSLPGKTSEDTDVVEARFLELVPDERIVQVVKFESDDPAFAGEMKMTWTLSPTVGGTRVIIACENVPIGIRKEDHDAGLRSTLENLANFLER